MKVATIVKIPRLWWFLFFRNSIMSSEGGELLFKAKCVPCHTFQANAPHKMGPNLWGLVGKKAGEVENYTYTTHVLKESLIVWDDESLFAFLDNAKKKVRGTKCLAMMKSEKDKNDVVAFIKGEKSILFERPRSSSSSVWEKATFVAFGVLLGSSMYAAYYK